MSGDVTAELLMRAAGGDMRSFADFYDLTVDQAFGLARVLCETVKDAEELLVRVYRAALQRVEQFAVSGVGARAWLLALVFTLARA